MKLLGIESESSFRFLGCKSMFADKCLGCKSESSLRFLEGESNAPPLLVFQMDPVQKAVINHTFGVSIPPKKKQVISCNICQLRFNSDCT
ncbi:hypothetical protein NFI96_008076, partial [Prochilodus magdalenae]